MEAEKDEETNGRYSLIVGDIFCTVFRLRTCMLEFTDYGAIIPAMRLNNTEINDKEIKVLTATRFMILRQTHIFCEKYFYYSSSTSGLLFNTIDHEAKGEEQRGLSEGD